MTWPRKPGMASNKLIKAYMDIEVVRQRCGEKLPKFKDLITCKEKVRTHKVNNNY